MIGIPDEVLSITGGVLVPLAARLTRLPLGVLAMKLLPPNVEGTAFAINMSLQVLPNLAGPLPKCAATARLCWVDRLTLIDRSTRRISAPP